MMLMLVIFVIAQQNLSVQVVDVRLGGEFEAAVCQRMKEKEGVIVEPKQGEDMRWQIAECIDLRGDMRQ